MGNPRSLDPRESSPGPGNYNPDVRYIKDKTPAYAFGEKVGYGPISDGPGPGAYDL
jgi:hypothetical protein